MGSHVRSVKQRPLEDQNRDNPEEGAEDPGQIIMRQQMIERAKPRREPEPGEDEDLELDEDTMRRLRRGNNDREARSLFNYRRRA